MVRAGVVGLVMALLVSACAAGPEVEGPTNERVTTTGVSSPSPSTTAGSSVVAATDFAVMRCTELPDGHSAVGQYRGTPIYVGNEMPVEAVRAWAVTQSGFESIWVDREHNGWVTVAFSEDAESRQADIEDLFADDGVMAVAVDWRMADLETLQDRVVSEMRNVFDSFGAGISVTQGVVGIDVPVLDDETRFQLDAMFGGDRVCVEGGDPADVPEPGIQKISGDGWRLLADEPGVGDVYRTGIASDASSYNDLWLTVGLPEPKPDVDFEDFVVIWFGPAVSGSCNDIRFDDVIVDRDSATVHALIVLPDPQVMCTDDANPHAYVVAVERSKLPQGPFAIQLSADGPPGGAPAERTLVHIDLSAPGAVAEPGDIGLDPSLPEPDFIVSGDVIEPGFPWEGRLYVHCGIEWWGELNGVTWKTDSTMPASWRALVSETETLDVQLELVEADVPQLLITAADETVIYLPTSEPVPGCD